MTYTILAIGCVALALTTIINLVMTMWRPLHKIAKSYKSMQDTLELHTAHLRKNYMALLRLVMFTDVLPLEERVNAGEKYLKADGNGTAKVQHETNVAELRERSICE